MRQRTLAILSLILLQFTLSPLQVASSANIAGKSCSKAGITKINGGLKHTCIKKGKKLIWNKGVATQPLTEAQPQPQPQPRPQPLNLYRKVVIRTPYLLGSSSF